MHVTAVIAVHLLDPEIEDFRYWQAFDTSNGQRVFCGEVNTASAPDAPEQFEPFLVRMKGKEAEEVRIGETASLGCDAAEKGSLPLTAA